MALFFCFYTKISAQKAELMIPGGSGSMSSIAYTADERILFTGGGISNSYIKIWDVKSGRLLKTLTHEDAGVLVSLPNQQAIAFCGMNSGKLYTLSAPEFKPRLLATLPYGISCYKMSATPDGKYLLLGGSNFIGQFRCPFIYKVNIADGSYTVLTKIEPYATDPKVTFDFSEMDLTTDGRYILARTSSSNPQQPPHTFYVFDAQTGAVISTPKGGLFYMCGNKLMKLYSKKIDDNNSEYTAGLVSLPDFSETAPVKLEKFITYVYQWDRKDYFFDESKNILYHAIGFNKGGNVVKLDVRTGKIMQRMLSAEEEANTGLSSFSYLPKTRKLIVNMTSPKFGDGINIIDANTLKSEFILGNIYRHGGNTIQYNPLTDALLINGGETKIFEIGKSSGNHKVHQFTYQSQQYVGKEGAAAWSPDGTKLAYTDYSKREIGVFDANNLSAKPKTATFSTNLNLRSPLVWYADSKKFIYGDLSKCIEADVLTPSVRIRSIGNEGYQSQFHLNSKNGQYIIQPAYRYNASENFIGREINYLVCYNAATGSKIWQSTYTSKGGLIPISFINNDKTLVAIEGVTGTLQYFDAATGQQQGNFGEPLNGFKVDATFNGAVMAASLSADGTKSIVIGGDKVVIYDIVNKTKVAELPRFPSVPNGICFLREDKFLAYTTYQGVKIFDIAQKKEVATIALFQNNKEWVISTPEGRFDASADIQEQMYYVKNDQIIPLSSLFEKFYTPKLLNRVLNGEIFEPVPVNVNTLKEAPTVKILIDNTSRNLIVADDIVTIAVQKEQINLRVQSDCPGDAVTEIRLFQNGKLVQTTRNLTVEDENAGEKTMTKLFAVNLEEGENHFKALAFNTQRTESQPAELTLTYKAPKTSNVITQNTDGINLYLIVIGINKYKNPKYNLNYAIADAAGFKEAMEKSGSAIFTKTNVVFINDENATKANISTELDKIKANASARDVFIFYYAGHGVINDKKEFYLVPHDVIQLYGADGALAQKGLSSDQLQQFSKDIKAQKQLFILDACQSAGALEVLVAARGAAEEKAIAQLARSTGTHWLTASGSEQFASEFSQLGHGTFTYVLLEALSGKADTGDKKLTVKEIDMYLQDRVPEVTSKYKGTPQYPASYGYGNDFPIGIVK